MQDIFSSWRAILVTACIAVVAGLGAGWLGAASFSAVKSDPFPTMLAQLMDDRSIALRPDQRRQIDALTRQYLDRRKQSGQEMHAALVQLSRSMLEENALGAESQSAADTVSSIAHQRRIESILYIVDTRKLLDEDQRRNFDRSFLRAIATDSSDRAN